MGKTKAVVHGSAKAFWRSKEIFFLFAGAASLGLAVIYAINYGISSPTEGYASTCANSLVPSYSYPNPPTFWNTMIDSNPPVTYLIANVNSGPGTQVDSNYTTVINNAEKAGITILGYVYTNYGSRSTASVEADIDGWKNLYGVTNIAIDEVSSAANEESYYQTLSDYIRNNDGAVFLNPGTIPDQGYMNIGDVINIFEGTESDFSSFSPPSWVGKYPSSKLAAVVFDVSASSDMQTILNELIKDGIGNIYITDENQPNPYSTVPSYWSSEVSDINNLCNSSGGVSGGGSSGGGDSGGGSSTGVGSGSSSSNSSNNNSGSSLPSNSIALPTNTTSNANKSTTVSNSSDSKQDASTSQIRAGSAIKASKAPKSNRQTIAIISGVATFIAITLAGIGLIKWTYL